MRAKTWLGAIALLLWCVPAASAGDVSVVIKDGRATVIADNAPVRQILAEWARVGQTKIVGAERLAGPPLTLQLQNVPERQALETLLRAASGYMAAPRAVPVQNASLYDRILILPTSSAPAMAVGAAGRPTPGPAVQQRPAPMPQPAAEAQQVEVADDREPEPDETNNDTPEANVDYANPELMLQRRQREMMRNPPATTMPQPGQIVPAPTSRGTTSAPAVFPGTAMPSPASAQTNPTSPRPGEIVAPPPTPNPYGLPAGVQPGSQVGPPVQPDRSKYMNPYQPQKPPDKP